MTEKPTTAPPNKAGKILSMDQIRQLDRDKRKAIVNEFHKYGYREKVLYNNDGTIRSGFDTYSRLHASFESLASQKGVSPPTYSINQIMRIKTPDGHEYLKIQCFVTVKNQQGIRKSFAADYGFYEWPIFEEDIISYNPETGAPIIGGYTIAQVDDQFTVPFSAEQVLALQKQFKPDDGKNAISLIIKEISGKKRTCESLEQFIGNYETSMAELKNFERSLEERLSNIVKGSVK
jgi:hypothetical protein